MEIFYVILFGFNLVYFGWIMNILGMRSIFDCVEGFVNIGFNGRDISDYGGEGIFINRVLKYMCEFWILVRNMVMRFNGIR